MVLNYLQQKYYVDTASSQSIDNLKNYFYDLLQTKDFENIECKEKNHSFLDYKYDIFVADWKEMKKTNNTNYNNIREEKIQNLKSILANAVNYPKRMVYINDEILRLNSTTEDNKSYIKAIFCTLNEIIDKIHNIVRTLKSETYDDYINLPSAINKINKYLFFLDASPFTNYQVS